ncbi:putative B3 domain-containing protein Os03g0621600 [Neltuma alba]|uniref:putative B3 domain-containing protein Os03g0621600 n=1 Tax=Neltuma alba TaxID=207710 RepID=UPI0010A41D18|nr:putative B3 domain-containing protein Os03g0621600 [Prosopis alba]
MDGWKKYFPPTYALSVATTCVTLSLFLILLPSKLNLIICVICFTSFFGFYIISWLHRSGEDMQKKPSFFKVLIEDFTTRLKIPPAFIKEFEEVPTKTILETYYGKSEEVEVKKFGSKFYFHNGWKRFVEVNNLETGDFLVLEYFEDYCKFKVKIYGKSDLHLLAKASMDRASQSQRKRKNSSFFKILIQDFSTRLQIPPAFNKVFGKEVPKKAILETYGKSEEVEVEKHDNRFCFCNGWSKFVEDNKLENGDFLVFKYVSDCSTFKVRIYGKTCCEKECYNSADFAGKRCSSQPEKNEDERNNNVGDGQKRKREEDGALKAAKRIEPDFDSDIGDEVSEDEAINIDSDASQHPIVEEEVGNSKQPTSEEAIRLHTENQTESESSSFQVKLRSSSINSYLNIPLRFSRKYITKENESQEIRIEMTNKVWEVGVLVFWAAGKKEVLTGARLTQGWRNLVSECHLQMGDVCNFELIQPTAHHQQLVFRLRVLRWDPQNDKFTQIL